LKNKSNRGEEDNGGMNIDCESNRHDSLNMYVHTKFRSCLRSQEDNEDSAIGPITNTEYTVS
jgi:hypothetical protein